MAAICVQVQNFSLVTLIDEELRRPPPVPKKNDKDGLKKKAKLPGFFPHKLHVCNYLVQHPEAGSPIIGEVPKKLIVPTPGPPTEKVVWDLDMTNINKWYNYVHDKCSTCDLYCWSTSLMKHTK